MERKRSVGITFFGWWFIVSGILGLLGTKNSQEIIQVYGISIFFINIILSGVSLVCGIFILKLNSLARKVAIITCLIAITMIPIRIKLTTKAFNFNDYHEKRKQIVLEQVKPEYQKKQLETLEMKQRISKKTIPILLLVFGIFSVGFELIPVYFFTRAKVKEQFK